MGNRNNAGVGIGEKNIFNLLLVNYSNELLHIEIEITFSNVMIQFTTMTIMKVMIVEYQGLH